MTDAFDPLGHLHPLNRVEQDFNDPEFRPLPYPQMPDPRHTLPKLTPEMEAEQRAAMAAHEQYLAETYRLYPTLSDFMKHVYDEFVAGRSHDRVYMPRRVAAPGGYHAHKSVAGQLYTTMFEIASKDRKHQAIMPTEVTAASVMYRVLDAAVPIYYVGDEFIRAVAATELPKDFTLQDLHFPMPGQVFAFPTAFMKEYTGRDISYVFAADFDGGEYVCPAALRFTDSYINKIIKAPATLAWQFHSYRQGAIESFVSGFWKKDPIDFALTHYGYTDYTYGPEERVNKDRDVTVLVNALMFKLLVVLETRPALVENGGISRPAKVCKRTGNVEQTELWSPNLIGFKYKATRHAAMPGDAGHHASPQWHWRKGHFTHQRVGSLKSPDFVSIATLPKREDNEVDWLKVPDEVRAAFWRSHKRLWLEPTLINFDEPEESKKQ